jgi:hypothetical protein
MGTDADGDADGKGKQKVERHQRNNNARRRPFFTGIKHVKIEGASTDLKGHVFDIMPSKTKQIDGYSSTLDHIKTYVGTNMDPLVLESIEDLTIKTLTEPMPIEQEDGLVTPIDMKKWEKCFQRYLSREELCDTALKKVFAIVWGQCSDAMQTRIPEDKSYNTVQKTKDGIGLIKIIKSISFNYRAHQEPVVALDAVKYELYKLTQEKHQTVQEYYDTFKNMVNVNAELGAKIGGNLGLLEILAMEAGTTVESLTSAETAEYSTRGKGRYLAIQMLMSSDRNQFGGLIEDLPNDYLTKNNKYPQTMGECFTLLNRWSRNPRNVPGAITPNNFGMAFVHDDDENGDTLVTNGEAVCTRCGRNNHTVEQCRARYHHDGTVLFMEEYDDDVNHDSYSDNDDTLDDDFDGLVFNMTDIEDDMSKQNQRKDIPKTWLLLDSQSTIDLACNAKLLTDIHQVEQCLTIRCNAGKCTTNLRGTMLGYGKM